MSRTSIQLFPAHCAAKGLKSRRKKTFKTSSFVVCVAMVTLRWTIAVTISLIALSIATGTTLQWQVQRWNTQLPNPETYISQNRVCQKQPPLKMQLQPQSAQLLVNHNMGIKYWCRQLEIHTKPSYQQQTCFHNGIVGSGGGICNYLTREGWVGLSTLQKSLSRGRKLIRQA